MLNLLTAVRIGIFLGMAARLALMPAWGQTALSSATTMVGGPTPVPAETSFTVLCYHRFTAHPEKVTIPLSEYTLPLAEFRWQMQYLKDHGITPISMEQLKDFWFYGTPLPDKPVLLTFDDGFRSIYEVAYPVLQKFKYPGVLFIYTNFIHNEGNSLKYADIKTMRKNGLALESHTKSHLNLGLMDEKTPAAEFKDLLAEELTVPIQFMKEKFDYDTTTLAYAYGVYNEKVLKATQAAGYQLAFTVNPGPNDRTVPPLKLKRDLIMNPTNHETFAAFFEPRVLHLGRFQPGDGEVIKSHRPTFVVEIKDDIDPQTIKFTLGEHLMKFVYNPKTRRLTHRIGANLKAGGHMVTLSAVDRAGQTRTITWYFRVKHESFETPEKTMEHSGERINESSGINE
jgi:peptidoglycan/xylan/chitin deacetylase (PgdA/CDA1 family)